MNNEHYIDNLAFDRVNDRIVEIQHIRSEILRFTTDYFLRKGFFLIDPPITHECIPNKKSEIYFSIGDQLFSLNSSNALYLSAYAVKMGQVFSISPTFRRENRSDSHLTEFRMLEVELLNCSYKKCMELVFDYIKSLLLSLCNMPKETEFDERINKLNNDFRIDFQSYINIIDKLKSHGYAIEYGSDLSDYDNEVSRIICNPTFVTDYPLPIASWTALPKDDKTAYAFNLILPDQYGELAEGCQKNNDHEVFICKFKKADIHVLDWYVEAIKGCKSERSGFGLGIDRIARWIIGSKEITETVLFPRF